MIVAETEEQLRCVLDQFYDHLLKGKDCYEQAFQTEKTERMTPLFEKALEEHYQTLMLFNELLDLWQIALPEEKRFISSYVADNNVFDSRNVSDFFTKAECEIKQYINDEKTWLITLPVCRNMWHKS